MPCCSALLCVPHRSRRSTDEPMYFRPLTQFTIRYTPVMGGLRGSRFSSDDSPQRPVLQRPLAGRGPAAVVASSGSKRTTNPVLRDNPLVVARLADEDPGGGGLARTPHRAGISGPADEADRALLAGAGGA